jgi:hypothetical protein
VLAGDPAGIRRIDGSFALVALGVTVRLARSLDRPCATSSRSATRSPALYVADRIDTLHEALGDGLAANSIRAIPAWCPRTISSK